MSQSTSDRFAARSARSARSAVSPWAVGLAAAGALALVACTDTIDAGGTGEPPADDDPLTSIDDEPAQGSLDHIFQHIIAPRCSPQPGLCHAGQFEPNLSTPSLTYAYMVNRPAIEKNDRLRVDPGNPEASFLIDKLRGRDVGTIMPLGATPLTEEDIQLVEDWIEDGALRRPGADPAPVLNNPPRSPEIAIFDGQGNRLDVGPFTVPAGSNLVLRHSVQDFETAEDGMAFTAFILSNVATGEQLQLSPGSGVGLTTFDPGGPMGIGDVLNYRYNLSIGTTLTLVNDLGQTRTVPASGQQFIPIALYADAEGIAAFTISQNTLTVE